MLVVAALAAPLALPAANNAILAWNNLGMHCMDSDYSVFSILPPYNTIEAQLIVGGKLIKSGSGYTVTYQAVADPDESFNSTAMGKGNFYTYSAALYGAALAPEMGLAGWAMPGMNNTPQAMLFEVTNRPAANVATLVNWFRAEGVPISPYDDAGRKNPYPLMRLIARNAANQPIATNDIVLPVSDEMSCGRCHASGRYNATRPYADWVWDGLPERDFRLNILRRHDEQEFLKHSELYSAALAARGFNPAGLYRSVMVDAKPVLCAACHASEALGTSGYGSVPQLTTSIHSFHGEVIDPDSRITLNSSANRAACYRCHPGSTTRCLRGAMGSAVAADGSLEMQCQSCHGTMSQVGSTNRVGWFMEPNCQSCHTGTATHNNGQIRYPSAFETNGTVRVAVDQTFATEPDTPAPGLSLYRFSTSHGGLQCEACHGSTHAEFPSTHRNDNLRNLSLQGHLGVMAECTACHTNSPSTITGGPHGLHPLGAAWVNTHPNVFDTGQATRAQCQVCHGADYRGTVLSQSQADRTLSAFGTKTFFRGAIIGCYNCHNGPSSESGNNNAAPSVTNVVTNTTNDRTVAVILPATGVGLTLRIISQPANGSVGLSNGVATYFPNPGLVGNDRFTFAAYDGSKNSLLATGTVAVAQGPHAISATAQAPPSYPAAWPVAFDVSPTVTNHAAPVIFDWDFGDGTAHNTNQFTTHTYVLPGSYDWTVISAVASVSVTNTGTIDIGVPVNLSATRGGNLITVSWPSTLADTLLEGSSSLGPSAQWISITNAPNFDPDFLSVTLPATGNEFFRVKRLW
jgi:PKD repeat protein